MTFDKSVCFLQDTSEYLFISRTDSNPVTGLEELLLGEELLKARNFFFFFFFESSVLFAFQKHSSWSRINFGNL